MSFTHLVERGQLHSSDTVDVLLDLGEEVLPSANESALLLILNHFQFVRLPRFAHL